MSSALTGELPYNDFVSSFSFDAVQSLIRCAQQLLRSGMAREGRNADGESHSVKNLASVLHGQVFQVFAQ